MEGRDVPIHTNMRGNIFDVPNLCPRFIPVGTANAIGWRVSSNSGYENIVELHFHERRFLGIDQRSLNLEIRSAFLLNKESKSNRILRG